MLLEEAVAMLPGDCTIAIGARSSFMFIGSREEYYRKIDEIEDVQYYNDVVRLIEEKCNSIKKALYVLERLRKNKKNGYVTGRKLQLVVNPLSTLRQKVTLAKQFLPVRLREVKELYYNDYDRRFQIIIEGTEDGSYWFRTEYEADWGKGANG